MSTLTLQLLRYLPRNLLSRTFGWVASRRRPEGLARWILRTFARRFDVDLSSAARTDLDAYESLHDLFTRELRADARPLGDGWVSPVDATVGACGQVSGGRLVQAKNIDYGLEALLGSSELAAAFTDAHYATLYLSPRDYHRIHSPAGGQIVRTLYEPGTLWPVNPPAVRTIPRLFAVNERITSVLETDDGLLAVVMVGATNVGSIRLSYSALRSNRTGSTRRHLLHDPPIAIERGAPLGQFAFGSTVIVLSQRHELSPPASGTWIAMGSSLDTPASDTGTPAAS